MQLIELDSIVVNSNRQRQEFDPEAMQELQDSLQKSFGLMQPIVVRETDPKHPGKRVLVAGERRLRAIRELAILGATIRHNGVTVPLGSIPATFTSDLSELELEEAELEENIRRRDLSWQERAAAEQRLHGLREKQATAAGKAHTVAATATELHGRADGYFQDSVRKNIILAKNLDDPEVAAAPTAKEAFKILKRKDEAKRNSDLAATVGATYKPSNALSLVNGDCLEYLAAIDKEVFDIVLTDPPYGMGADEFGDAGGAAVQLHKYDDSYESWKKLMAEWIPLVTAACKPQAHLYAFCDIDRFAELRAMLYVAGWRVHRTPLIWHKPQAQRVPWPEHGPRRHYELICYAVKGDKTTLVIKPDVLSYSLDEHLGHSAQKPVALLTDLLSRSARPGDKILDCFAGTGAIIPAAVAAKCQVTAVELEPANYGICLNRVKTLDFGILQHTTQVVEVPK